MIPWCWFVDHSPHGVGSLRPPFAACPGSVAIGGVITVRIPDANFHHTLVLVGCRHRIAPNAARPVETPAGPTGPQCSVRELQEGRRRLLFLYVHVRASLETGGRGEVRQALMERTDMNEDRQ